VKLHNTMSNSLGRYVAAQVRALFPIEDDGILEGMIEAHVPEALRRVGTCIDDVRMWRPGEFDVLHSSQYCTFLYYLANTIWRREGNSTVCTRLFCLNKALNGIDCFYEIELPEVFFIGHSVGIVLAKATYGNHLVLYQNSTVGKNHGHAPIIEPRVVLYPNTAVIGSSHVKAGSLISQGVSVINRDTEAGMIAYQGAAGGLVFRAPAHNVIGDFFRSLSA
jgi:serine O-acetyltransferase